MLKITPTSLLPLLLVSVITFQTLACSGIDINDIDLVKATYNAEEFIESYIRCLEEIDTDIERNLNRCTFGRTLSDAATEALNRMYQELKDTANEVASLQIDQNLADLSRVLNKSHSFHHHMLHYVETLYAERNTPDSQQLQQEKRKRATILRKALYQAIAQVRIAMRDFLNEYYMPSCLCCHRGIRCYPKRCSTRYTKLYNSRTLANALLVGIVVCMAVTLVPFMLLKRYDDDRSGYFLAIIITEIVALIIGTGVRYTLFGARTRKTTFAELNRAMRDLINLYPERIIADLLPSALPTQDPAPAALDEGDEWASCSYYSYSDDGAGLPVATQRAATEPPSLEASYES